MLFDDLAGQVGRLKASLENPSIPVKPVGPLLNQIGMLGVETSQNAFKEQKLGDIKWEPRYPGQGEPKFNIAGAIQDWKAGKKNPKPNRFQDRPANVDEGMRGGLWGSLSWRAEGKRVVWGSNKPYAGRANRGGFVTIPYDKSTKDRMADWLYAPGSLRPQRKKTVKEVFRKGTVKTLGGKVQRAEYAKYIRPLLRSNVWTQRVIARPFVGITETLERDINRAVADYYTGVQQ